MITREQNTNHQLNMSTLIGKLPLPVLLYILAVVVPVRFNVGPLSLSGVRALLLVMIVPLTIKLFIGKYGRILWTDVLFYLYILWTLVSLSINNPDVVVETVGSTAVEFLGGYVLARAYIRTPEAFAALYRLLIIIVCCTLPFAIYETLTGHPIIMDFIRKLPGLQTEADVRNPARMGLERVQVVFAHPIHYGLFCSVIFAPAFVGFKGIYSTPKRYITSLIIGLCVFFSLSSGALLSMLLQLWFVFWAWVFRTIKARWFLLLGLLALAYVAIDILSNRTPMRVFMTYATFSPHNAYWRGLIFEHGIQNVWDNPIFGLGLNDWVRPWWMHSSSIDNFWLLAAIQFGIPGFLLLSGGFLYPIFRIGSRNFESDLPLWRMRRAWMFTFVGLTFTLSTVAVWATIYSFVFFLFGAGMWFITAKPNEGTETPDLKTIRQSPVMRRSMAEGLYARKSKTNAAPKTDANDTARKTLSPAIRRDTNPVFTRFPVNPRSDTSLQSSWARRTQARGEKRDDQENTEED